MTRHYQYFIPPNALSELYNNLLPSLFWNRIHNLTLTNRFLLPLHAKHPSSNYIAHQLIGLHGSVPGLKLERHQLDSELSAYLDDFVQVHWREIEYKVGEHVYAEYEGEWYVATVLSIDTDARSTQKGAESATGGDSLSGVGAVVSDEVSGESAFSRIVDSSSITPTTSSDLQSDMFEVSEFVKEKEESQEVIDATVKEEDVSGGITNDSRTSHKEDYVYHIRFVGYGNEALVKKESMKPYIDIPSEYLKSQTPVHAVFYEDSQLYEAVVDTYLPDTNTAVVKFIGYGNKQDTELFDIRVLTNEAKSNWYKFDPYTLSKAQSEFKADAAERMELWMRLAPQELPQESKNEVLNIIEKEDRGELDWTVDSASSEQLIDEQPESTDQSGGDVSQKQSKSKRKGGGKRKREEREAEQAASQWNNWMKKSRKKGTGAENVFKKTSRINETVNQIEVPILYPPQQKPNTSTANTEKDEAITSEPPRDHSLQKEKSGNNTFESETKKSDSESTFTNIFDTLQKRSNQEFGRNDSQTTRESNPTLVHDDRRNSPFHPHHQQRYHSSRDNNKANSFRNSDLNNDRSRSTYNNNNNGRRNDWQGDRHGNRSNDRYNRNNHNYGERYGDRSGYRHGDRTYERNIDSHSRNNVRGFQSNANPYPPSIPNTYNDRRGNPRNVGGGGNPLERGHMGQQNPGRPDRQRD